MNDTPPPATARVTLRRTAISLLGVVVLLPLVTLLAVGAMVSDLATLRGALAGARWGWVAAGFAVFFLQYPVMGWRWRVLLGLPRERRPPLLEMSGYMLVAHLFDLVVPGPAGDLAAAYLLRLRRGVAMAHAVAASAYGRLFGLLLLALVPAVGTALAVRELPPVVATTLESGLALAAVGVGGMMVLALFPRLFGRVVEAAASWLPARWRRSPGLLGRSLRAVLGFLIGLPAHARTIGATPARLVGALLLSGGVLAVNGLSLLCIFRGLAIDLSYGWCVLVFCVSVLSHMVGLSVPGSGNVAAPVVVLALMSGVLGIEQGDVVAALLLAWSPSVLACMAGLVTSIPNFPHIARAIERARSGAPEDEVEGDRA